MAFTPKQVNMLSEYIPDLYPWVGDRYKLKGILRTKASTRSPQQTPYSFYVPQSTVDPVAVSAVR